MLLSPTEIIQSFRLRFWRESRGGVLEDWRGEVWHEQQGPDDAAVVVADPEQAFDLVRHALQRFSGMPDSATQPAEHPSGPDPSYGLTRPPGRPKRPHFLRTFWRKLWRKQQ